MRIGIDAHILGKNKGGVERYVNALVSFIPDMMPDHNFIIFVGSHFNGQRLEKPNVRYVALPFSGPIFQRTVVLPLATILYRLDILHVQRVLPLFLGCSGVVSVHDLLPLANPEDHTGFRNMLIRFLTGSSIRRACRVLTVSKTVHKEITEMFSMKYHKVISVYNGVDHTRFYSKTDRTSFLGDNKKGNKILYIGAIEPRKNLETAISAVKIALQGNFKDLSLTIAGGIRDHSYAEQLTKLVADLDLRNKVFFTGHIPDESCFDLLKEATLFLAPSKGEGFDLPPLEAMACGVPVICSNIAVHRELFAKKAAFFSPRSPLELSQTICQLLNDPEKIERLIDRGLQHASNFTWENTVRGIAKVYKNIGFEQQHIPMTCSRTEDV